MVLGGSALDHVDTSQSSSAPILTFSSILSWFGVGARFAFKSLSVYLYHLCHAPFCNPSFNSLDLNSCIQFPLAHDLWERFERVRQTQRFKHLDSLPDWQSVKLTRTIIRLVSWSFNCDLLAALHYVNFFWLRTFFLISGAWLAVQAIKASISFIGVEWSAPIWATASLTAPMSTRAFVGDSFAFFKSPFNDIVSFLVFLPAFSISTFC